MIRSTWIELALIKSSAGDDFRYVQIVHATLSDQASFDCQVIPFESRSVIGHRHTRIVGLLVSVIWAMQHIADGCLR